VWIIVCGALWLYLLTWYHLFCFDVLVTVSTVLVSRCEGNTGRWWRCCHHGNSWLSDYVHNYCNRDNYPSQIWDPWTSQHKIWNRWTFVLNFIQIAYWRGFWHMLEIWHILYCCGLLCIFWNLRLLELVGVSIVMGKHNIPIVHVV